MAIPYERYDDEIEEDPDNISSASEDAAEDGSHGEFLEGGPRHEANQRRRMRQPDVFSEKWPDRMATVLLAWGFVIFSLGAVQTVLIPLLRDSDNSCLIVTLAKSNCYGLGLWAGLAMILTGSIGLRATRTHNVSMVYLFFFFILLDLALFIAFILLIMIAFGNHWTTKDAFTSTDLAGFYIHIAVSLSTVFGFVFIVLAYTQYYEDVFCGELQCCKRAVHCFCPCICPRVVHQDELLNQDYTERPPSLPI